MKQKAKQTATKALYLFYFEQIIQHHLVLNVLLPALCSTPYEVIIVRWRVFFVPVTYLNNSLRLINQAA